MFKRFIYTVVLSALVLTSCDSIMDDAPCVAGDGALRTVTFTIAMDDASKQTRAAWGDGYTAEDAIEYENRIAPDGLKVVFYTSSNRYVGEATSMMYWPDQTNPGIYRFSGDVSALNLAPGTEYKIMVLANGPESSGNIGDLQFTLADADYPKGYIPMWGVNQFVAGSEELQDAGTIDMLRAMAKIEVVLSNEMLANGYTLDAVQLTHYNSSGYCLPQGWNSVARTVLLDQEGCFRAMHSHVAENLALKEVQENKSYWMYVPEFNVLHTATNRPVLSVTLGDGTSVPLEFPNALRFGSYNANGEFVEGSEQNIVRNHIYRFNITAIAGGLEIDYEVLDWEDGGTWDRGEFEYPTYHNPVVPDYANPAADITMVPAMKYNNTATPEDDAFVAWFKLEKPAGQLWTPVIDKSDTEYEIRVYDEGGTRVLDPADWKASDNWYQIMILPLKAENAGTTVKFGITYTQSWMPAGTSMYLIINGKADDIAWPDSGNDPKIIEIKQN